MMTSHRLALISSLLTGSSFAFHLPTTTIHRQPSLTNNNHNHHHHHQQRSQSVTLHQYPISITENAPRDTITITDWAINYGIGLGDTFQLTAAQQDDAIHDDVYTITSQPIAPSTPILSIPSNVILTGSMARQELGSQTFGAEDSLLLSDHQPFYLFLKVLTEYELGDQSPWYYWLNSLPRYYSNGASMTDFCFGCLPPYAAGLALAEKKRYKQYVEALSSISFLSEESKQSEEVTKWAFNVVFTRYMELPGGDVALVPMADYLNHGAEPNVDISYDEEGNCYVYSMTEVGAGEPLVFSYGDSTNPSNLLARYGFLDESSSATFCKYVIENPTFEMFNLGYPNSMYFYNDGGISNEVWDVLLYELLKVSPEEQQHFYQAHMSGDEGTKASYHDQYFAQTYKSITSHVDYILNELDELGIGLETQIAQGQDKKRHPRLPLIMRHNEFVKGTFDNVRQNLDNMYA
eukprot:scaffold9252_cov160-Skeletonema_marinoi.AAC.3